MDLITLFVFLFLVSILVFFVGKTILYFEFKAAEAEAEEPVDVEYESACAWRGINLALTHPDHEEASIELAALRRAGWHIEKSGHHRAGFVYLKLIAPDHKE